MDPTLHVLLVEDDEDDALWAEEALRLGGYTVLAQRVDTATALDTALARQPWDLILCDYRMPSFSGMDALAIVRQQAPDLPFILLSGIIGEETAVAALQAGADDYIMKGNPARLVPSVRQALRAVAERRGRQQAEAALRASEARYRSLVEASPDAIALLDRRGVIQMANRQAAILYHYTDPRALIGQNALELVVPADRERVAAALSDVAAGETLGMHTYTAQRHDGTTFCLELQSTRVNAEDADTVGSIMIIGRDVTEHTQAAERLALQAHLLESVGDSIIATDAVGLITYWNRAAEALYGWAPAEVMGRNILSIIPTESSRAQDTESLASLGGGTPESGEYLARHRSGRVIPILASAVPVHDKAGVVVGIIAVSTDISTRVQAEEALRQSERFAYAVIDALDEHLAILNAEGMILAVNAAWRTFARDKGWTDSQIGVGANYLAVCDGAALAGKETARRLAQGIRDILAQRISSFQQEYPSDDPPEQHWFAVHATRFAGDGPVRVVVAHQNITARVRAEEAVRHSTAWYRALSEQATDLVHVADPTGVFLYVSPSHQRLLGYDPQALLGTNRATLIHPDDRVSAGEAFGYLDDGVVAVAEFRLRHVDGSWRWVEAVGVGRLQDPIIRGIRVTARDITARKEAEERLTVERDLLQTLIDAAPDPIYIKDAQFRFVRVNAAQARLLGAATTEELVGKTDFDYYPRGLARQLVARERRLLATGEPVINDLEDQSSRGQGKRWLLSSKVPLRQADRITGLIGVSRDITALKQSEEERERFFMLSVDLLCVTGSDGYFKIVNPAFERTLGFTPEELYAEPFLRFVHPDDQAATLAQVARLVSGTLSTAFENRYRCKDGTYRWLLWNAVPVPAEGLIYATARDITERKAMEQRLYQQIRRISALHTIDISIAASLDLRVTLGIVVEQVCIQLGVDAAQVLLLNKHTLILEPAAMWGFRDVSVSSPRLRLGQGHPGRAALEQRLITAPNFAQEEVIRLPLTAIEGFVSYAAAPLVVKGQVCGVLEVFHRAPLVPDPEWLDYLTTLASQLAVAIDNATLFTDLQQSNMELVLAYDATIEGWSRALDLRDKETEGHSRRVSMKTLALVKAMGLSGAELVHAHRGALLHDIGKMGVPDAILLKPGPLNEEEWVQMRRHPGLAYDLLSPISHLRPALDIPYCHHEKWDGTGYPRGLVGAQIPLAARIFAVVDVSDALLSDRPYRAAWSREQVRAHIASLSGSHFDPDVVAAFLELAADDSDR